MKKEIGKNTLGGGKKMSLSLKNYNRSTHNLSYAWRSSMNVGTLVPCMKILGLPGDTFDVSIDAKVMTHPTIGPLFGSYKLQIDIFTCPIRLYVAQLHNNAINIGMNMAQVKLPQFEQKILGSDVAEVRQGVIPQNLQISSSSALAYLGIRGWGVKAISTVQKCALGILTYLDTFKNYYANKQEEHFPMIHHQKANLEVSDNLTNQDGYITGGSFTVTFNPQGINKVLDTSWTEWRYIFKNEDNMKMYVEGKEIENYFNIQRLESQNAQAYLFQYKQGQTTLYGTSLEVVGVSYATLEKWKLKDIDDIREKLLKLGNAQAIISTEASDNVGSKLLQRYLSRVDLTNDEKSPMCSAFKQEGLLVKTHQSDIFTNWVNNEWIDGENGISAITAISTKDNKFTIDQLNLSKKVYDMLNRIAVSGGTYRDWIETVYTSRYIPQPETPIYEGGYSDEIIFGEVVSNSATEDEPLGTLAGRGSLAGERSKKGGRLHIRVSEPSILLGIVSITPRVDYCQQNDWDTELKTMDDLHKPALDGIGYQDLREGDFVWWAPEPNVVVGKQPAWINYMTNYNKTYGTFAEPNNEAFMCLNRFFYPQAEYNGQTEIWDNVGTTSYINPNDFNYTFAESDLDSQNFWVQIGFGINARRVMSAKQIPNL